MQSATGRLNSTNTVLAASEADPASSELQNGSVGLAPNSRFAVANDGVSSMQPLRPPRGPAENVVNSKGGLPGLALGSITHGEVEQHDQKKRDIPKENIHPTIEDVSLTDKQIQRGGAAFSLRTSTAVSISWLQ